MAIIPLIHLECRMSGIIELHILYFYINGNKHLKTWKLHEGLTLTLQRHVKQTLWNKNPVKQKDLSTKWI